jgi:hypothetical protein
MKMAIFNAIYRLARQPRGVLVIDIADFTIEQVENIHRLPVIRLTR